MRGFGGVYNAVADISELGCQRDHTTTPNDGVHRTVPSATYHGPIRRSFWLESGREISSSRPSSACRSAFVKMDVACGFLGLDPGQVSGKVNLDSIELDRSLVSPS